MLGPLEQQIMDVIWKAGKPLKPSEVNSLLGDVSAYTTVMTVLTRLADKHILKREKRGKAYFYSAQQSRSHFARLTLKKMFSDVVSTYGELAISQFVDTVKTEKEDLQLLKKIIEEEPS